MQTPNEHDLAALRFQAAAHDLEQIVRHIAQRYIAKAVPLTWRLLHAIEAEALADLGLASRHDAHVLDLFRRPRDLAWPETDDPVDFGKSNALPAAFGFVIETYEEVAQVAPDMPDTKRDRGIYPPGSRPSTFRTASGHG
ncbi:serine/threonine protein kinase [Burkholderia sp. WAC0059]|uniref:DUF2471 family protein n=1 Tax=Burkholderia sp. WAC0059 TaxID=2066022 RepID=UPI000C7EF44B|nr:DUF2471 family protein [Burkholderia sp. WAC0059]PLZ04461.1 serine/threonine protein kinase [Burkholderia sp. WAC0059]